MHKTLGGSISITLKLGTVVAHSYSPRTQVIEVVLEDSLAYMTTHFKKK